jgi:bifunctional non-homologous end joining protein LigD
MSTQTMHAAGRDIDVSNVDKLLYPDDGVTKGDVLEHYRAVAEAMLPQLAGRPLVPRRDGDGTVGHVVCEDAATLLYLANQAVLEFHIWPSRVDSLDHPDRLVIDLDPPEGTAVATLREVARQARRLFDSVGLTPYVQATGGRGFHVVAPLDRSADYPFVRDLAAGLAEELAG